MSRIHNLILTHGRDQALRLATATERPLVDIAARILEEENTNLGITYSGFCLTSLPHRRLPDDQDWERAGNRVSLLIEPGKIPVNGQLRTYGVPYGSRARMILIYLQTQALKENSPTVELGRSMNAWLDRMDIPACGKNYREVAEQAARISACRLTFWWQDGNGADAFKKDSIVEGGIRLQQPHDDARQTAFWQDTVQLSGSFYRALRDHPVPIWEPAVRAISGKSMALAISIWLAYRLHVLSRPTPISWTALHAQFGGGYRLVRQFKPQFLQALSYALAVYPEARVDAEDGQGGIVLHPGPAPIPERLIGRR